LVDVETQRDRAGSSASRMEAYLSSIWSTFNGSEADRPSGWDGLLPGQSSSLKARCDELQRALDQERLRSSVVEALSHDMAGVHAVRLVEAWNLPSCECV
jgi:hypothetical protein